MSIRLAELKKELFSACRDGDLDRVRRVVAAGVDPKKAISEDYYYWGRPLHTACGYVLSSSVHVVFVSPRISLPSMRDEEVSACSTHMSQVAIPERTLYPPYIGVGTMGAPGARAPLCFSDSYVARLNFIHTDHTALAYRSIEPPFTKLSSYASALLSTVIHLSSVGVQVYLWRTSVSVTVDGGVDRWSKCSITKNFEG